MDTKNLLYFGVIIALVIAVAAPFIASSNPDGLESAFFGIFGAKEIQGSELDEDAAGAAEEQVQEITGNTFSFASPFPDYGIEGLEKAGEALAIVIGTLLVLAVALGLGRVLSRSE
ncbi:MAG: PDGLE domain-containing protein [Methanolinea sp.]|jgi:cobalt/nickel transport protein|nr:PDGLE domain-containing protein [Methanolinea sp.]